jgi:uncharacterized membrane protein
MSRVLKHLVIDLALWFLLAVCFFKMPYANYAENVLSFLGVFLLILATICLFAITTVAKSIAKEPKYKPRSGFYKGYMFLTSCAEISVVAAMGWYWVAAGFALYAIVMTSVRNEADNLYVPTH